MFLIDRGNEFGILLVANGSESSDIGQSLDMVTGMIISDIVLGIINKSNYQNEKKLHEPDANLPVGLTQGSWSGCDRQPESDQNSVDNCKTMLKTKKRSGRYWA